MPNNSEDAVESLVGARPRYQRNRRNGTRVDHGVLRCLGDVVDTDLVERLTGGLDTDLGVDRVLADQVQRQRIGERLGDGLDGEFHCRVAGFVDVPIRRRQAQPKAFRVDGGQFGDIARQSAIAQFDLLGTNPVQVVLYQLGHGSQSIREPAPTTMSLFR